MTTVVGRMREDPILHLRLVVDPPEHRPCGCGLRADNTATSTHNGVTQPAEPRAPGGYEMGATELTVIGVSPIDYPIQPKEHGIDFLLDNRHFWLRTPKQRATQS